MDQEQDQAADVGYRRRCLTVNSGIYARSHGETLLALVGEGAAVWKRLRSDLDWLMSEPDWTPRDERRIAMLCAEVLRQSHREPDRRDAILWHAIRLRELLNQYAVIMALEARHSRRPVWPSRSTHAFGKTSDMPKRRHSGR